MRRHPRRIRLSVAIIPALRLLSITRLASMPSMSRSMSTSGMPASTILAIEASDFSHGTTIIPSTPRDMSAPTI